MLVQNDTSYNTINDTSYISNTSTYNNFPICNIVYFKYFIQVLHIQLIALEVIPIKYHYITLYGTYQPSVSLGYSVYI